MYLFKNGPAIAPDSRWLMTGCGNFSLVMCIKYGDLSSLEIILKNGLYLFISFDSSNNDSISEETSICSMEWILETNSRVFGPSLTGDWK